MPNIPELRRVLAFIVVNPEKHDQTQWCGTAQCLAGWACTLNGYEPVPYDLEDVRDFVRLVGDDSETGEHVEDVAMRIFEIDGWQASRLFDSQNTIGDINCIIDRLERNPKAYSNPWTNES